MTQPTDNYWQNKVSLWLHDPPDKMLDIRGHEGRAAELARLLDMTVPDKNIYQQADMIAAGLTRAALPKYDGENASQNGAVDFKTGPTLTHPLVKGCELTLQLGDAKIEAVHKALCELVSEDLGLGKTVEQLGVIPPDERPLNGFFDRKSTPEEWAKALYFYLFFALQKRLRQTNTGGLGCAWDMLPADSRMPDHPLWHHLGLASAVGSCRDADKDGEVALAIFSITPVQPFIGKARKLRDHWVGSVILSYLAFAGIRHVAENLGPDHVLYPSLHNQSLVEAWLGRDFHLGRFLEEQDAALRKLQQSGAGIASFPNKFVFLAPAGTAGDCCREIENAVQNEWLRLARLVKEAFVKRYGAGETMNALFEHQIGDYWQFNHAACRLAGPKEREALASLLLKEKWEEEADILQAFARQYSHPETARFYGASHSLAQTLLAAAKLKPTRVRKPQQGEKCPLCGEHEVLHDFGDAGKTGAAEYGRAVKAFWDTIRSKENGKDSFSQIGESERLCAVCAVKRFLPQVMEWSGNRDELLADMFKGADKFPSTTEMAAHRYMRALTEQVTISKDEYERLIGTLHAAELDNAEDDEHSRAIQAIIREAREKGVPFTDRDKYYALLLMDGDKMGELINGKTLSATWGDALHPELRARFKDEKFCSDSPLRADMKQTDSSPEKTENLPLLNHTRLLNPALHAAISDGLNSFARYAVAPAISRAGGRLIYAGGDDVCAILPLDTALKAADDIRKAYVMGFVRYGADGAEELSGAVPPDTAKLGLHLGKAEKISISGAIVIAHHKEPLREVLRDAHEVLDGVAKNRAGRNALAIRLKKRSGGDRDLWFKWEAPNPYLAGQDEALPQESLLESLEQVMRGVSDDVLGGSLLYRLADLKNALRPLVGDGAAAANRDKVVQLIAYEVGHSEKLWRRGDKAADPELFARRLAGLMLPEAAAKDSDAEGTWFNPEAAVIAHFLALPTERRDA